ncbi:HlyD family secretion protein [Neobacillus sp. Marseille-QA0830]
MEGKGFLHNKRLWTIIISLLAVLLAAFIYFIILQLKPLEMKSTQAKEQSKYYTIKGPEPISIDGTIYPEEEQIVTKLLFNEQYETEIAVKDGQLVKKGDLILTAINKEMKDQAQMNDDKIAKLQNDITKKESQIASLSNELKKLDSDVQTISQQIQTLTREIDSTSTVQTQVTADSDETNQVPNSGTNNTEQDVLLKKKTAELATLTDKRESLKMDIEQKKAEQKVEIDSVEALTAEKEELFNQNEYITKRMKNEVFAEQNGTVYFNNYIGQPETNELLKIVSDPLIVLSEVSQFDFEEITENAPVTIRDIVSNGEFKGKVLKKLHLPKDAGNESSRFQVIFAIEGDIQIGYDVVVTLKSEKIDLPLNTIEEDEQGNQYVYLKQKNNEDLKRKISCEKTINQICQLNDQSLQMNEQIKVLGTGDEHDTVK